MQGERVLDWLLLLQFQGSHQSHRQGLDSESKCLLNNELRNIKKPVLSIFVGWRSSPGEVSQVASSSK